MLVDAGAEAQSVRPLPLLTQERGMKRIQTPFPAPRKGAGDVWATQWVISFPVEIWTIPLPRSWMRLSPGTFVHPASVYGEGMQF